VSKSNKGDWQRVSKRRRCPVCGKPDWCLFAGDDDAPTAAICQRVESDRRAGEAGWLHRLRDDGPVWSPVRRLISAALRGAIGGRPDLARLAARWRLPEASPQLARLAGSLGVTPYSLFRLAAGWSPDRHCWSFPMTDAAGRVLGIRLRRPDGRKLAVRGGREGLFVPAGLAAAGGRLLVCEGPTDTAALLDLGFAAVGRPSCTGGVKLLVELVGQRQPAEVVIVADGDQPGQRGANALAVSLAAYVPGVRIITPPVGIKDARAWRQAGATAADVAVAIDAAPVRRLTISTSRKGRRHERRQQTAR